MMKARFSDVSFGGGALMMKRNLLELKEKSRKIFFRHFNKFLFQLFLSREVKNL